MDLFIIFWNRLNIRIPAVFSSDLLNSFFVRLVLIVVESCSKGVIGILWEAPLTCFSISCIFRRLGELIPFNVWRSQKWNTVCKLLSGVNFAMIFPFVWDVPVKDKWCGINRRLECALCRSHRRSILWFVLNTHRLNSLSGYRFAWSILPEEFRVCHGWVIEGNMIIHWAIKVLSICDVSNHVIFWALHVEIGDPAKLAVDVSILWNGWIIGHPSSLDFIHFVGIVLSSWLYQNRLLRLESFVKVLLIVGVISCIKKRWTVVMSFVPLVIIRR